MYAYNAINCHKKIQYYRAYLQYRKPSWRRFAFRECFLFFFFSYRLIDLENCSPQREMNSVFACDLAPVLSSPLSGAVLESPSLID